MQLPNATSAAPKAHREIGGYVLDGALGRGGMAEVFLVHRPNDVAGAAKLCLKVMLPDVSRDPNAAAMFRDEAHITAKLVHPHIVRVFDFGSDRGSLFIVMELVVGKSARELCRQRALPPWVAAHLTERMARGLHHAHQLKDAHERPLELIHRDVSPHNVLVSNTGVVKVADFGIAKVAFGGETEATSGHIKGKLSYMSPEQLRGEQLDHKTDQFATGACLWQYLTGQLLFAGAAAEIARAVLAGVVPPPTKNNADVPLELQAICLRALKRDRNERFADMQAFAEALHRANPLPMAERERLLAREVVGEGALAFAAKAPAKDSDVQSRHAAPTLAFAPRGIPLRPLVAVGVVGIVVGVGSAWWARRPVVVDACAQQTADVKELARGSEALLQAERALSAGALGTATHLAEDAVAVHGTARAHLVAGKALWLSQQKPAALSHLSCILERWPVSAEADAARQMLGLDPPHTPELPRPK